MGSVFGSVTRRPLDLSLFFLIVIISALVTAVISALHCLSTSSVLPDCVCNCGPSLADEYLISRFSPNSANKSGGTPDDASPSRTQKLKGADHARLRGSSTWEEYQGIEKRIKLVDVDIPDGDDEQVRSQLKQLKERRSLLNLHIPIMDRLNNPRTKQHNPELLKVIRDYYIYPPSDQPYQLLNPEIKDFSRGQSAIIDSVLQRKEHGFFVEVGALDGEGRSNSLFFERERKWTGLLIEAGSVNFDQLLRRNRKAFLINACISTIKHPSVVIFEKHMNIGKINHAVSGGNVGRASKVSQRNARVQCFPLQSMLLALGQRRLISKCRPKVDFFSLDIEGHELAALKTIPWDQVDIRTLTVEYAHGNKEELRAYVKSKGYLDIGEVYRPDGSAKDILFVKKDIRWPA